MEPARKRRNDIRKTIGNNYRLLNKWETHLLTVSDPSEEQKTRNEIERIKGLIKELKEELNSINIKLNRLLILCIAMLVIGLGMAAYYYWPASMPDYAEYLDQMKAGDSLMKKQQFNEARIAYKKAARYNKGDAAVDRKISLLDSASQFVKEKKFNNAKDLFDIIIAIPASATLSKTALQGAGVQHNAPLQVTISTNGAVIEIRISGGVPFSNEKLPYEVEGINCNNCIQWKKSGNGYMASVASAKVQTEMLRLKDRLGQFTDSYISNIAYTQGDQPYNPQQTGSYPEASVMPPPAPTATKEEMFTRTVQVGDSLFTLKKYTDALNAYTAAGNLKPADQTIKKKIADCGAAMLEAARKIPRSTLSDGSFTMGTDNGKPDDGPAHTVSLSRFALGKTEVTVAQYRSYCTYTGKQMPQTPGYGWNENAPIVNVSWEDAQAYCKWVGGRLPTEAEWEYAAAASTTNTYSGSNRVDNVAIYGGNSRGKPAAVSLKAVNGFGLYDMTGNVAEWCADWYNRKYYEQSGASNPKGAASGNEKVIRGGAYNSSTNSTQDGNQLRITYRNSESPAARYPYIGFRVAFDL